MIRWTWRNLLPLLNRGPRKMLALSGAAALGGIVDACVLILIVRTALSITGEPIADVNIPFTGLSLNTGSMLLCAVGLGIVAMILHLTIAWLTARMSSDVFINSRERAIRSFSDATWHRQAQVREGALQETVSTLSYNSSQLAIAFAAGVAAALNLLALLAAAALVDALATLVVVGAGSLLFIVLRPIARLTRRHARLFVSANSYFAEETSKDASLAMEFRVFGVTDRAAAELEALNLSTARRNFQSTFASRFGSTLYRDLATLFLIGAISALYLTGADGLAGIGTIIILIIRALSSAQTVQSVHQTLNEQGPNLEALHDRLKSLSDEPAVDGPAHLSTIGSIIFDNVGYEYRPGDRALYDINFEIRPGEVLGIVGPSGGGKSTLVQVLVRLRPPVVGTVTIGGRDYQEYQSADWARLVSVVPQEPRLMEASIAENIAFKRTDISRAQIEKAAAEAYVLTDILSFGAGFSTVLGPRGGGISGGQKQRIAIARALVGGPELLVLDEPTSALDISSERLLQRTISSLKGSITMVIVAHRLSTLAACDRILVLKDGTIETIGTPDELLDRAGFFQTVSRNFVDAGDNEHREPAVEPSLVRTEQHEVL